MALLKFEKIIYSSLAFKIELEILILLYLL